MPRSWKNSKENKTQKEISKKKKKKKFLLRNYTQKGIARFKI